MTLIPLNRPTSPGWSQPVLTNRSLTPGPWPERARVLVARPPNASGGALERSLKPDFEVLTTSGEIDDIVRVFDDSSADLVIVDVGSDGLDLRLLLEALRTARADAGIVVVGDLMHDEDVAAAVTMDVAGLIVDPDGAEKVAECVRQVLAGRLALDQRAMRRVIKSLSSRLANIEEAVRRLSQRELQIVRLVGVGLSNREIAGRLALAEGTIKVHLHNVFEKLQVRGRKELADYARRRGL
jgi:two-component system nitrate/nitrite response regulator NarL